MLGHPVPGTWYATRYQKNGGVLGGKRHSTVLFALIRCLRLHALVDDGNAPVLDGVPRAQAKNIASAQHPRPVASTLRET